MTLSPLLQLLLRLWRYEAYNALPSVPTTLLDLGAPGAYLSVARQVVQSTAGCRSEITYFDDHQQRALRCLIGTWQLLSCLPQEGPRCGLSVIWVVSQVMYSAQLFFGFERISDRRSLLLGLDVSEGRESVRSRRGTM